MPRVDPADDSIRRFIVRHYRFDPERHERRHVVVAAFDNEREYSRFLNEAHGDLMARRAHGEEVDPREHISGTVRQPGDDRRAANGRLVVRAFRHGVTPGEWIEDLEMPSHVALMRAGSARRSPVAAVRSLPWRLARWVRRSG